MKQRWAIISGGGTAGHVQPGLDIAAALVAGGVATDDILYVGSERGIETTLVPAAGFDLEVLPGRGIARKLSVQNIGAVVGLLRAIGRAFTLLRRTKPAVVVSLGGYASVPCALWAVVLRVPIVVAEQNAVPGLANRLVGRFAKVCATSFPDVDLPRARWTGNPVRAEIRAVDRAAERSRARQALDIPADDVAVAVFGGSLGARRINEATLDVVENWADRKGFTVRHIVGRRDFASVSERVPPPDTNLVNYHLVEYESDMASVYAAADLLVCRAGATTVAELAVVGAPSILVPLPGAPGDHQTKNAEGLVAAGAAVMIADAELTGERLGAAIDALLDEPGRLDAMAAGAASLGHPEAATEVAALVHATASRPTS